MLPPYVGPHFPSFQVPWPMIQGATLRKGIIRYTALKPKEYRLKKIIPNTKGYYFIN